MARSFIKKIQDNFQYDKKMYNEFVQKYGFTLPKFLFTKSYLNIFYDTNEDVVLERLSRLKDFSEVEIEKILKLIKEYPILVKSPNYRWWFNDKYLHTFISDYSKNFDVINKILELDLVDFYIKFSNLLKYYTINSICDKVSKNLVYGKKLLEKMPVTKNAMLCLINNYDTMIKILKQKYPNEDLVLNNFLDNENFKTFYSKNYDKNEYFHLIISQLKDFDDIEYIENIFEILKHDNVISMLELDKKTLIEKLVTDKDFYQNMIFLTKEVFYWKRLEIGKNKFINPTRFFNSIFLSLDDVNSMKRLFQKMIFFADYLLQIPYEEIEDDYIKDCYVRIVNIFNSNDINYVRDAIIKFNNEYDIFEREKRIDSYIVEKGFQKISENLKDIDERDDIRKTTAFYEGHEIPIYHLEGQDFNLLIHYSKDYQDWKKDYGNSFSTSIIHERHNASFRSYKGNFEVSGNYCTFAFKMPDYHDIHEISLYDAGTTRYQIYDDLYPDSLVVMQKILNRDYLIKKHNELHIDTKVNGEKRLPSFIICNEQNSSVYRIAAEFNIGIILINRKKYQERFTNEYLFWSEKLRNTTDEKEILSILNKMSLNLDTTLLWSGDIDISKDYEIIFNCLSKLSDNINVDNYKEFLLLIFEYEQAQTLLQNNFNSVDRMYECCLSNIEQSFTSSFIQKMLKDVPEFKFLLDKILKNCCLICYQEKNLSNEESIIKR